MDYFDDETNSSSSFDLEVNDEGQEDGETLTLAVRESACWIFFVLLFLTGVADADNDDSHLVTSQLGCSR